MQRKLTDKIYKELLNHVGEQNAIHSKALATKFKVSKRLIRKTMQDIRNSPEYEKVIGSSNQGYFICTEADVEKSNKRLFSSAYSLLKTAKANSLKAGLNGQGRLINDEFLSEFYETLGDEETTDKPQKGE